MKNLFPDHEFRDVTEIDEKIFEGKDLLVFDIDNTLFYPETTETRQDVLDWFRQIRDKYHCVCLSNSHTILQRRDTLTKILGCNIFISQHKKPSRKLFRHLQRVYRVPASKIAIIGDMRLTDIFFGNRHNATTVLVHPLSKEKLRRIALARRIENFLVTASFPFKS